MISLGSDDEKVENALRYSVIINSNFKLTEDMNFICQSTTPKKKQKLEAPDQ
jgi:hypothetical protein